MGGVLAGVLYAQIRATQYTPWLYWLSVVMVSIIGTLITDNLTDTLDLPLMTSTLCFSPLLAAIFWLWFKVESSLSIHSISKPMRELFYWTAILSRSELEERIDGCNEEVESNAIEFIIHSLRKKLGTDVIKNIRGVGWMVDRET